MVISVIGQGYVGLVTASVFADLGNTVYGVDIVKERIEGLKRGVIPFFEPGLEEMVKRNLKVGRLKFTTNYKEAIYNSEVVFICVGTPSRDNGEVDLSFVFKATEKVGKNLNNYKVIVCKSTVPPGTNKKIRKTLEKIKRKEGDFDIASCPEFLREGTAIHDTLNPDRVVIGVDSEKAKKILLALHEPIDGEFLITNTETAEMIKYAANSFLATKISFANAISFLCEKIGADVEKVMDGVGFDKRIGRAFLYPGLGYGGSCLPKDIKALITIAKKLGYNFNLLKAVDKINNEATQRFIDKVKRILDGKVGGKIIAIWGLSFKPNTDDMREAPSIKIINTLVKLRAKIKAYDPQALDVAQKIFGQKIEYINNPYEAVKGADILLIITEWNEFKHIDLARIKKLMKKPIICDGRNIYEPETMKRLGFTYISIGRT